MNREERENALHCLRVMIDEKVCEECNLYGTTGTDHCEADCVRIAIEALEQELVWIPVSERLPQPQKEGSSDYSDWLQITVHIAKNNDVVCSGYYCFSKHKWYTDRIIIGTVTAWKSLSSPFEPKAGSEDSK